jgi:HSP20 family protein
MRTFTPYQTRSIINDFNTFFDRSLRNQPLHQLFSTETGWVITLDLPGFRKDEVTLDFEDKTLVLTANQESDSEPTRPAVTQRYALGEEVDTAGITAALENGVLQVTLPKKEQSADENRTINIQ